MESCHDGDAKQEEDPSLREKSVTNKADETHYEHHATDQFEWLTSLESLDDLLLLALEMSTTTNSNSSDTIRQSSTRARVLDVGCGSSILGEYLLEHPTLNRLISQVVNVDKDKETLQAMQERWKQKTTTLRNNNNNSNRHDDDDDDMYHRLLFLPPIDFVEQSIDCPRSPTASESGSPLFHLIVDKSTLDCALCTDYAAAALLCQVHRLLRPENGVYLVISFHHVDFLRPLLQDCPGTDWELTFHVIHREIEKDSGMDTATATITSSVLPPQPDSCLLHSNGTYASSPSAWSSGCFNPNESYRRTVNAVLCCRRGRKDPSSETTAACNNILDRDAVYQHINDTIEQWYRFQNPLLTETRSKELEQAFLSSCQDDDGKEKEGSITKLYHDAAQELDLPSAFVALFTPAEREHLTYEHFLEDWHAFHDKRPELPVDTLSYETAVAFLQEMQ